MKRLVLILAALALLVIPALADIFQAVQSGDCGQVKSLLAAQPELLNHRNEMGINPLEMAAWLGKTEVVRILLAAGADAVRANPRGDTPLHGAALSGNCDILTLFLEKGAAINARGGGGDTPLHNAVAEGRAAAAELLLARGADANAVNDEGKTPLHYAASLEDALVRLLLGKDATADRPDQYGHTPLHLAAEAGNVGGIASLMAAGAQAARPDRFGATPLHIAVYSGHEATVKALLAAGPDMKAKDLHGRTAMDIARWRGLPAVAALLRAAGATEGGSIQTPAVFPGGGRETGLATLLRISILVDNTLSGGRKPANRGASGSDRTTDSPGPGDGLQSDWGFSCLVEGLEKTILFDAGNKPTVFTGNARTMNIDLTKIQQVILSHPHGDHMGGFLALLPARPGLPLLLPYSTPYTLTARMEGVGAVVTMVREPYLVCPHAVLSGEMAKGGEKEQSLIIHTAKGLVIVTGCAHQGIVPLLERAKALFSCNIHMVVGGFHLLMQSEEEVKRIISRFKELGVEYCGATHCTGERAIELFRAAYGDRFVPLGAGRIIEVK